jgi:hypothetical protein
MNHAYTEGNSSYRFEGRTDSSLRSPPSQGLCPDSQVAVRTDVFYNTDVDSKEAVGKLENFLGAVEDAFHALASKPIFSSRSPGRFLIAVDAVNEVQ